MGALKVFTMFVLLALLACAGDSGGPLTVYTLAADYTMVGDDITHTSCSAAVDEAYDMVPCCPDGEPLAFSAYSTYVGVTCGEGGDRVVVNVPITATVVDGVAFYNEPCAQQDAGGSIIGAAMCCPDGFDLRGLSIDHFNLVCVQR